MIRSLLCTCALALFAAAQPALAQGISTQGPGDGCAPHLDGTVNTQCLAVFTNLFFREGTTGEWERLEADTLPPAPAPQAVLLPLMPDDFGSGTYPRQSMSLATNDGHSVDFLLSAEPGGTGIQDRVEYAGRLVRRDDELWHVLQLVRRTTCIIVADWQANCP